MPDSSVSNSAQCQSSIQNYNVLLSSTTLINVWSNTGSRIQCRALFDKTSQNSLIKKNCVERLNLSLYCITHRLVEMNGISAETCLNLTEFKFSPYFSNNFNSLKVFVVKQFITLISGWKGIIFCTIISSRIQSFIVSAPLIFY